MLPSTGITQLLYSIVFEKLWKRYSATRFLTSCFFHESVSLKPLSIPSGPFQIFSKICGDVCGSSCTTDVVDTSRKWKKYSIRKLFVRLSLDRMGPLGKPPASLALLPSRTSSRTRSYPVLFELQCLYEAIRVWSYTTFVLIEAVVNRKLAVET